MADEGKRRRTDEERAYREYLMDLPYDEIHTLLADKEAEAAQANERLRSMERIWSLHERFPDSTGPADAIRMLYEEPSE